MLIGDVCVIGDCVMVFVWLCVILFGMLLMVLYFEWLYLKLIDVEWLCVLCVFFCLWWDELFLCWLIWFVIVDWCFDVVFSV